MYYPGLEKVRQYKKDYQAVPICRKICSDLYTPLQVLKKLKAISHHCYMLESVEDAKVWGRYTFLGYEPKLEITCKDGMVKIKDGMEISFQSEQPDLYIRKILEAYKSPKIKDMPTFTGGLTGYFSYDYLQYQEPSLKGGQGEEEGFLDFDLMLFDKVIVFDHLKQQIIFIANVKMDRLEENYQKVKIEIENMISLVKNGKEKEAETLKMAEEFQPLFDEKRFCTMVEKAKDYIKEGDIFQVVLSNRLEAKGKGSLLDTYRVLRMTNPSPYMFYFSSDDVEIAGASPETLVKLANDTVYTFPLAGTRPRGKNESEDKKLEEELLKDKKELAEHNMLVDLGRNDIGKISRFGSVKVQKYMEIERFSHVMHIGSTITGKIQEDKQAMDAIGAVLPAGTLSGAPKIRACQIINELEKNKRGIYGGAIGYLDFAGNMDTCIAIRIAYKKNGKVFIRSGAGIVADSIPQKEFQECIQKAKAVIKAVEIAEGGLEE